MNSKTVRPDVRQLPSGRWQARMRLDDGSRKTLGSFDSEGAATEAWWTARADRQRGQWWDDSKGNTLFRDFVPEAFEILAKNLSKGTLRNYRTLANKNLLPTFGHLPLNMISKALIRKWWAGMPDSQNSRNAYYCLRSIMREATELGMVRNNPVQAKGSAKDRSTPRPEHTYEEFQDVVAQLPYQLVRLPGRSSARTSGSVSWPVSIVGTSTQRPVSSC